MLISSYGHAGLKKWLLISSGMIMSSLLLAGGAIWYLRAHHEDAPAVAGKSNWSVRLNPEEARSVPLGQDDHSAATPAPAPADPGLRVTSADPNSIAGPNTGSNAGSGSSSAAANATPKPDDFSQFDQYKDRTSTLYQEVQVGAGEGAVAGKTLTMNYRGWLTTGQIFDETYARKQPFTFKLGGGQVITGWEQGVTGMKVGGKRRLIVPPAVGYGNQANGPIPPNSLLVFDVELLSIK